MYRYFWVFGLFLLFPMISCEYTESLDIETVYGPLSGYIRPGDEVTILGSGFGEDQGKVFLSKVAVPVLDWSPNRIQIQIQAHHVSGTLMVITPDKRFGEGPRLLLAGNPGNVEDAYEQFIRDYAAEVGYSVEWVEWMIANRDRYVRAFHRVESERRHLRIAYTYVDDVPYAGRKLEIAREEIHMQTLKEYLEAVYPGYTFELSFYLNRHLPSAAPVDFVIWGNASTNVYDFRFRHVLVSNDGILSHEIGHYLGLPHHYPAQAQAGEGHFMPPGDERCRMDRTRGWCSGCAAVLGLYPDDLDQELETVTRFKLRAWERP